MSNEVATIPMRDMERMAQVIAHSGFFGVKDAGQAMALMLVAQAEGRHPASVAMDYHIIQGRPALKADTALSRYLSAGGKVEWHDMTDEKVSATFTHPSSGAVKIDWDIKRAKSAGLIGKPGGMFEKYPRAMLRSRVISEGVRCSCPGVLGGMYTPEEVGQFTEKEVDVIEHDEKVEAAKVAVRERLILACEPIAQVDPIAYSVVLSLAKTSHDLAVVEIEVNTARRDARGKLNSMVKGTMKEKNLDKAGLDQLSKSSYPTVSRWEELTLEQAFHVYGEIK